MSATNPADLLRAFASETLSCSASVLYNDKMHAAGPYGFWRGVSMELMALWHRAAG